MTDSVVTSVLDPEDEEVERSLRPRRLDDFVGQERIKEQLGIALDAAKGRDEALDHVLLAGPPGLGKTTLAQIIREELGVGLRTVAGPELETAGAAEGAERVERADGFQRRDPQGRHGGGQFPGDPGHGQRPFVREVMEQGALGETGPGDDGT